MFIFVLMAYGCAAQKPVAEGQPRFYRQSVASAALAFDPPAARNMPQIDLSREPRERSAFVGFDQLTTTFFYVYSDDKLNTSDEFISRYERRAISERSGVSYR